MVWKKLFTEKAHAGLGEDTAESLLAGTVVGAGGASVMHVCS